ncbi:3-hydroxyisobutyrate dehydrogenase [Afifella pfennigii]|uniref:3-hydroxyisobutyrate dehydrogenase n=1 Tax=Afifella pfennigii TaxID=209897 RepID=UPI0004787368|nr:3-hydroxyisobutyrate dehydrogenase [Afifella pfennigii]
MARIAFFGLGNMGAPMARNLAKAGHEVVGYDVSEKAVSAFVEAGGRAAGSLAEAVREAGIVVTMLPAGPQVDAVYRGEGGILSSARQGTLLIDCSTIDVATARAVAATAAEAGMAMLDAPVSGGTGGAEAGTLTFMVGGEKDAFATAEPLFQAMGKTIVHCGASGTGQAAKMCNNMILGISMIGVAEAFGLADRLGLDRQKLFDVSSKSSGQCWSLTTYCPVPGPVPTSPANRDYQAGFTAAMMLKDLKLARAAASETGAAVPLGSGATELFNLFCATGGGETDFSGIFRFLEGQVPKQM